MPGGPKKTATSLKTVIDPTDRSATVKTVHFDLRKKDLIVPVGKNRFTKNVSPVAILLKDLIPTAL